jgi:hypothetical protein
VIPVDPVLKGGRAETVLRVNIGNSILFQSTVILAIPCIPGILVLVMIFLLLGLPGRLFFTPPLPHLLGRWEAVHKVSIGPPRRLSSLD